MIALAPVLWLSLPLFFLNFNAMYIPENMKVNKFVDVAIPSNRSYFDRLGEVKPAGSYTGDDVAVLAQDKVSQIADYEAYAKSLEESNYKKDEK